MAILRIERARPQGIVFSQSPLTNVSVKAWKKLVARMLELAFLGKPVCLITPAETAASWDLDFPQLTEDCETYLIGGYRYLCAFVQNADAATLKAIAGSQDLYLGPVWMTPLTKADQDRLFAVVEAKLKAGLFDWPQTSVELFYSNPDGDTMYWLNPSQAEATLLEQLRRLAQEAGWRVDSELSAR